jgi:4-hydroxythreonine-4-phosphate dehydrogenase
VAAAACIEHAVGLARAGDIAAIVTAPIHKEALAAAGVRFPGHTEMLQALAADGAGAPPVRMMLANDELRTVLVTIHLSLRRAIDAVTFDAVLETLRIAHRSAALWGQPAPRIAVAGLNPHAGEGGLFGRDEIEMIRPTVEAAAKTGIACTGPYPADTVYIRAFAGEFDSVVAMYHDQGQIATKLRGFNRGVTVTAGLETVFTTPSHGTAFDIVGTGVAKTGALESAVRLAAQLVSIKVKEAAHAN